MAIEPLLLLVGRTPPLYDPVLQPLPIHSLGILAALASSCSTLAALTRRLATFHPTLLYRTGVAVFRCRALGTRWLSIATVVVELSCRAHPNVGSIPFLSDRVCSEFITWILLLVNLRQRLPLLLHSILHLALFLPLLRPARVHHFSDHLELLLLLRLPHGKRHLIVLFLDTVLLHLLQRVGRRHVLMVAHVIA